MKKTAIILAIIISILLAIFVGYAIYNNNRPNIASKEQNVTKISEVIEDDCTDEYEYDKNQEILKTNSEEEKTSPNAIITFKKVYNECNHEIVEQKNIGSDLVNKTKAELQEKYDEWNIESFSPSKIIMSKRIGGRCGEEFVLKEKQGKIVIYKINDKNQEEEYQTTDIATDYLTEPDKVNIKNGLKVVGKQELNKMIEDFE